LNGDGSKNGENGKGLYKKGIIRGVILQAWLQNLADSLLIQTVKLFASEQKAPKNLMGKKHFQKENLY
jgi:hypothetical protein